MTSLVMHIGALMVNIRNQHPRVRAGKGMSESMKFHINACQMDRWNILSMARRAHFVVQQIPTPHT